MNNSLQPLLKQHRAFNFIFMWIFIILSYIMFFTGAPYYILAIGASLVNMSAILIFSAFIDEEEKKPTHSPEVKWDPKKKNDDTKL